MALATMGAMEEQGTDTQKVAAEPNPSGGEGGDPTRSAWPLAVSTLGMPRAPLPEFLALAQKHGCTAVDLRAAEGECVHVGLDAQQRQAIRRACAAAGLAVLAVSSYVKICAPGDDAAVVQNLADHLRLAADLGAPGVRVFPGGAGDGQDDDRARRRLAAAAPIAQRCAVRVWVETHDSHPRGADVRRLLTGPWPDGVVGAIWDAAHPWIAGEEPATTWRALADVLEFVQLKDVTARKVGAEPRLMGDGVLPWETITEQLRAGGYARPLCLEWEKLWFPELPDLDAALGAAATWLSTVNATATPQGGRR